MIEAAPIVSIVVPIYNGERYLRDSLDSLLAQTFQDFEIICVNDGSTDSSESIINEYAERDSRVKIVNQANGGVASARNAGIENAEGRYLLFCDDDDLFASNMLEAMNGTMPTSAFPTVTSSTWQTTSALSISISSIRNSCQRKNASLLATRESIS